MRKMEKRTFALKDHWQGPTVSIGVDVKFVLRVLLTLLLLKQVAVVIYLISIGRFDLTMFTYWNYAILTAFYVLLWVALAVERVLLSFVTLFAFPIPLGTTFLVALAIVIVINENEAVLTSNAAAGMAMSLIHTGDWILHSLPVLEMLLLLASGWLFYARTIIGNELASFSSSERKAAYVLYFLLCPLIPLGAYCVMFDPAVHYPTGIPTYVLWLGLVLIDILWMLVMYLAFTTSANVSVTIVGWFARGAAIGAPVSAGSIATDSSPAPPSFYVAESAVPAFVYDDNDDNNDAVPSHSFLFDPSASFVSQQQQHRVEIVPRPTASFNTTNRTSAKVNLVVGNDNRPVHL